MPNWKSYESSVRLLSAIVAAHPELKLKYDEVGRFYGGGTTYKSVWGRMSQINKHAETLRDAIQSGIDPITVELNEVSSGAVKPKAKAIASNYGEENANGGGGSAVKAKATPRKRTPAKAKKSSTSDDDEEMETPSKPKSNLHKVASGRVTKTGRASAKAKNYAELSEEDDIEVFKSELEGFVDVPTGKTPNGRFDLNSQQWSNGGQGDEDEDDYFHDVDQGDEA